MWIKKTQKLVCNMYDKRKYVVHIRTLKQSLNNGLVREKVVKKIIPQQIGFQKIY